MFTRNPRGRLAAAISIALAAGVTQAREAAPATDERMEEVIVSGSLSRYSALKSDTPIMETARSVTIESLRDIQDKGALTLDDTFTYSAGVTGETYGFATRGDWLKVRGLDVPQYQDSLQSLFGNYNNTRPDVYTLEQVEILKGPASVLYGKGSPGGLVNVVSKRPREEAAHEIVLDYGSFDRAQLALDSMGAIDAGGKWLYRVVGVYREADTQVDRVTDDSVVFAPSITFRPTDSSNITLLYNYTRYDNDTAAQYLPVQGTLQAAPNGKHIDSSAYFGEPGFNKYDAETHALTLLADHQFNEVWGMEITARYTDASADYQQAWTAFLPTPGRYVYNPDGSLYKDGTVPRTFYRNDQTSEQAAIDARLRASFDTGGLSHEVLMGVQYQDVTTGAAGYYEFAPGYDFATGLPDDVLGDTYWINVFNPRYGASAPLDYLNSRYTVRPDTESIDYGVYINDQISVDNWRITLGLRYDDTETETAGQSQQDDALSGAAGVLYQFDNGFAPYVSWAQSFEPVIGNNNDPDNPRPLDPQEGEQWEYGVKYQPDDFPGMVTFAYFDIEQTNLNDPAGEPTVIQQQSGVARFEGWELESLIDFGAITWELNLSQIDTETANGFHVDSVPEKQASTWVGYRPGGQLAGFKAGAGLRYLGKRYGGADIIEVASVTLVDLMVGYEFDRWDLSVNVRNAGDREYFASCLDRGDCWPGDERSIVGRVHYRF
ncbi:TonB-dependent siderophore receptor [Parahaliea mediterranea]|uniref:TonB-dependent siderophore receptor n=1 Tax=Parahaliea mediterranea TaxID=651086 RepID=A0A939DE65_9GAMM|nr:TonB-dependent siderophore receptor [Parahaliea mediterranea]MBN7796419.1 TonB-dependent siderophore receptor [Parahaliea mediterranea]